MSRLQPILGNMQQRREAVTGSASAPLSYNPRKHEVTATLSKGSPVKRAYGTEVLRISPDAVDLSRLKQGGIPLLDHHSQAGIDQVLGRLTEAWFERGALVGRLQFARTEQGKKAEGMVARGEITGLSAGYRVEDWLITDADGDVVDEHDVRWDDDLTFTAMRWQLFEVSLVGVPADAIASVRSLGGRRRLTEIEAIRARMQCRARMVARMSKVLSHE